MPEEERNAVISLLYRSCFRPAGGYAKMYGCSDVTVAYMKNGKGRETVDFLAYEPGRDAFRCYGIPSSADSLKRGGAGSWYGHYNYLVVTSRLACLMPFPEWKKTVPEGVGLIVANPEQEWLKVKINPKYWEVADGMAEELKNSLLKTMFERMPRTGI